MTRKPSTSSAAEDGLEVVEGGSLCDSPELGRLQAEFCAVFSNATRLRVLCALADGEMAVGDLALKLELPIQNLSQQLRVLRDKGAVVTRREGKYIYYSVATPYFTEGLRLIRRGLVDVMSRRGEVLGSIRADPDID